MKVPIDGHLVFFIKRILTAAINKCIVFQSKPKVSIKHKFNIAVIYKQQMFPEYTI